MYRIKCEFNFYGPYEVKYWMRNPHDEVLYFRSIADAEDYLYYNGYIKASEKHFYLQRDPYHNCYSNNFYIRRFRQ